MAGCAEHMDRAIHTGEFVEQLLDCLFLRRVKV